MNRVAPLMIMALAILAFAMFFLVIAPGVEIRAQPPSPGLKPYTAAQQRGRDHYVALGCLYCHSQQPRAGDQAPDRERGWGRASVASDYYYDKPHQLGTMRTGPDLFNEAARSPSREWQLTHLYQPRGIHSWSIMPAFPFLFKVKDRADPGDVVVALSPKYRVANKVVVARPEALDLVEYILSLDHTYPAPPKGIRDDGYSDTRGQE